MAMFNIGCQNKEEIPRAEEGKTALIAENQIDSEGEKERNIVFMKHKKHCDWKNKGVKIKTKDGKPHSVEYGGKTTLQGFSLLECWKKVKKFFGFKSISFHGSGDSGEASIGYEITDEQNGFVYNQIDTVTLLEPILIESFRTELNYDVQLQPGVYLYNSSENGYIIPFVVLNTITTQPVE